MKKVEPHEVSCKGCDTSFVTTKRFAPRSAGSTPGWWCTSCQEAGKDWRPQVMVAREKHGDRYFNALTRRDAKASALTLLAERFNEGYWYYKPEPPTGETELSKAKIAQLPEGDIKELALKQWKTHERRLASYQRQLDEYNAIVEAVESKDGNLAWEALWLRSDGEYESVSFELLEGGETD